MLQKSVIQKEHWRWGSLRMGESGTVTSLNAWRVVDKSSKHLAVIKREGDRHMRSLYTSVVIDFTGNILLQYSED